MSSVSKIVFVARFFLTFRILLRGGSRVCAVDWKTSRNEIRISERLRISRPRVYPARNKWEGRLVRGSETGSIAEAVTPSARRRASYATRVSLLLIPYPLFLIPTAPLRVIIYIIVIVFHLLPFLLRLFFSASFSSHRSSSSFRTGPSSFSAGYRCFHHSREGPRLPLPRSYLPSSLFSSFPPLVHRVSSPRLIISTLIGSEEFRVG